MSTEPVPAVDEVAPVEPLLALPGAVLAVGGTVVAHYGRPVPEQRALAAGRAVVRLGDRGVVAVSGPDRLSWLDSLTSQSLAGLAPGDSAETLLLDPHGRVEHAMHVVDDGTTAHLIVERSSAQPLAAFLDRMRFMLRVEVADRSDDLVVLGAVGDAPLPVAAPAGAPLVWRDPWAAPPVGGATRAAGAHPGADLAWRELLLERDRQDEVAALVRDGAVTAAGVDAAEALRIAAWRPRAAAEVDERTIPHELDWLRSAVHLSKGCYRGQETVAKVHNLGRPPRRLVFLHLDGSESVLPVRGDAVIDPDGREVGTVTSSARHHELGPIALAVVRRGLDPSAPLVVVTADGERVDAAQESVVPADAGPAVDVPRLPRLGRVTRG